MAYAPAAIGLRLAELLDASVGQAIVFMRLAGVLVYTWVVAAALFALRQSTFVWVIFAVGALPAAVFQASVISADSVTNCVSVFFVALVAKGAFLRRQLRPWESYGLVVGALLLSAVKPTYVLLVPLLFLLPPEQLRFGPRHRSPDARVSSRRRFAVLGAVGVTSAASLVLAALWAGLVSGAFVARADGQNRPVGRAAHQLGFVVGHPVEMTRIFARTLGDLGWRYFLEFFSQMGYHVQGSTTSVGLCIVAFGLALGITERGRLSSWRLATMLLVLLLSVLAIFTTLYLTFTLVGYYQIRGVQGRYFIPLAVLAALAVSAASPFRLATAEGGVERKAAIGIVVLSALALLSEAGKYLLLMYFTVA